MTKIKLCGLTRLCDIETANELTPEYIGFVFAPKSRRYIPYERAAELKGHLNNDIISVGVFVNENPKIISSLLDRGIINIAQLHGNEDDKYIQNLHILTDKPIIKAFKINTEQDILFAEKSTADYVLLDSGNGGSGTIFDWKLTQKLKRPYFLAGGLNINNVKIAIENLKPYAVDVSSGIETNGFKDKNKMCKFVHIVREKGEV